MKKSSQNLKYLRTILVFLLATATTQIALANCFSVYVSTSSKTLVGEIVTVTYIDPDTKKPVQTHQFQIEQQEPTHNSACAEPGEYIVRFSGSGMVWQQFNNLLINSRTELRAHMRPGDDGRVLIVSEPYEFIEE